MANNEEQLYSKITSAIEFAADGAGNINLEPSSGGFTAKVTGLGKKPLDIAVLAQTLGNHDYYPSSINTSGNGVSIAISKGSIPQYTIQMEEDYQNESGETNIIKRRDSPKKRKSDKKKKRGFSGVLIKSALVGMAAAGLLRGCSDYYVRNLEYMGGQAGEAVAHTSVLTTEKVPRVFEKTGNKMASIIKDYTGYGSHKISDLFKMLGVDSYIPKTEEEKTLDSLIDNLGRLGEKSNKLADDLSKIEKSTSTGKKLLEKIGLSGYDKEKMRELAKDVLREKVVSPTIKDFLEFYGKALKKYNCNVRVELQDIGNRGVRIAYNLDNILDKLLFGIPKRTFSSTRLYQLKAHLRWKRFFNRGLPSLKEYTKKELQALININSFKKSEMSVNLDDYNNALTKYVKIVTDTLKSDSIPDKQRKDFWNYFVVGTVMQQRVQEFKKAVNNFTYKNMISERKDGKLIPNEKYKQMIADYDRVEINQEYIIKRALEEGIIRKSDFEKVYSRREERKSFIRAGESAGKRAADFVNNPYIPLAGGLMASILAAAGLNKRRRNYNARLE